MDKQNKKISEEQKFKVHVDRKTLENPGKTKELANLEKKNPNIEFDLEHPAISNSSSSSSSSSTSMATQMEGFDAQITPQDKATIKYLSNVKDSNTNEVSKPFTIGEKKYQMVRGMTPEKNIVVGVYCFDDVDDNGENIIHPMDYFEENIANPMKETMGMQGQDIQAVNDDYDYAADEIEYHDKKSFIDSLNLRDIDPSYKHFFVNIKTGEISAMFKNMKEMIKSGVKLGPDEDYMDVKALKRFRVGNYFNEGLNEETSEDDNTKTSKLKTDVKKLAGLIKNKFSGYLSKLDKPIEQAEFLTTMAKDINKLSSLINSYKDMAKDETSENKVLTKKALEESLRSKRIIKVKDIK
jgi:hypothetical protein